MSQSSCIITLNNLNGSNDAKIINNNDSLSFNGESRYDFDNDVYAKNVKLANETDIQILQNEIDSLPLAGYSYINGNQETSLLGGIPFGIGGINTLIQSPDLIYDATNKLVKVDNINLATQTQIDTLQGEIDALTPNNPYVFINSAGITSTNNQISFTDGSLNGMVTDPSFTYFNGGDPVLTVGAAQIISTNNNMKLETTDYILTTKDIYLQGTEDVQRYLTVGVTNQTDNVKIYVDINSNDYICSNELTTKTQWKLASEYDFDNDVRIGDVSTSKKLYVNDVEITPSSGSNITPGMLRALNINQIVPTLAQTYNIVWSNLTVAEKALWANGSSEPLSSSDNRWNFTKLSVGTQKINWTIPFDFLTNLIPFTDIKSLYAIVRLNTSSNISAEGYMWFQIESQNAIPNPPAYRTRWNYANSASGVMSQLGYTFKIFAFDSIPSSTAASNTGKGQEPTQTSFKNNPCDVEPNLFSIPFSKFVASPSGDLTSGYTSGNVQSIALNTASNINTYNFDLLSIGFNTVRYNLYFA